MNRSPYFLVQGLLALCVLVSTSGSVCAQGANKGANAGNVTVTFTNTTTKKVIVNSSAPGRPLQAFAELQAGQSAKMQAYPGQRWVFVNTNHKVLGEYETSAEQRQAFSITLGSGGAQNPVPGGNEKPNAAPGGKTNPNRGNTDSPAGNTGSNATQQQAQQIVNYHNQKRAEVGSGNVTWSSQIARFAQQRADNIARTKKFAHLPQGQNPYGENIAQGGGSGGSSGYTVVNACDGWYAEKAKMPRNARTMTVDLFNRGVGHYTQMVWKGSTQIGAGIAQYQQGGLTMTVVVCCYNPPGNMLSQAIY